MKPLVIFVHGLGGSAAGTWGNFPAFLKTRPDVAERWDVDHFEYETGIGFVPTLRQAAAELREALRTKWAGRPRIAILAHSQGGLIARRCIADLLDAEAAMPIDRLMTFATPHHGAGAASVVGIFGHRQVGDLDPNSRFLWDLGEVWGKVDGDRRVHCRSVIAGLDAVVGEVSALGAWHPDHVVISGKGHIDLVKPKSATDQVVRTVVGFLSDESRSPYGVRADHRVPVLRLNHVPRSEAARFVYSARFVEFVGREKDVERLYDFLDAPEQPFRWMVLHGSGGVGKSRLALELCLALHQEWHAGFLAQDQQAPDWVRWQPMVPTLIVVDYAARDTEMVRGLLRRLAGRGPSDGTAQLRAPVRLLMIERTGAGDWLDHIVGTGTDAAIVTAAKAADLPLETIDDPWPIVSSVFRDAEKPLPEREETLAELARIDPERRPLFAHFAADALVHGQDIRKFDATRLLEQVIERARENFWRYDGTKATKAEERLLAVATMANGISVGLIESYDTPLLPAWDVDRHPGIYAAMTGRACSDRVPPLEPDIVGEHFVLSTLGGGTLGQEKRRTLCDLAWSADPLATAQFSLRAHRDVPGHPMLGELRRPPAGAPGVDLPIRLWAMTATNLMVDLPIRDPVAARALLDELRDVADTRKEPAIWVLWAKAAFNLVYHLRSRDLHAARALLDELRDVAETDDEPAIWEAWAKAVTNLMVDLRSRNPDAARALLDDLRTVATTRGEPTIWMEWAKAAFNLINDPISRDPDAARDLLDDLRSVAETRGEAAIWKQWAKAVTNLMFDLQSRDTDAARDLLHELRAVAEARDEPAIWEPWAKAVTNLMFDLQSRDTDAARDLLHELRGVADTRGEPAIWEQWAMAATNLTIDLRSRDTTAARGLLDDLRVVAESRGEPAIWEPWGTSALVIALSDPVDVKSAVAAVLAKIDELPQEARERVTPVLEKFFVALSKAARAAGSGPPPDMP